MNEDKFTRAIELLREHSYHRNCEDPWYACPKHEDYSLHGGETRETLKCDCGADEIIEFLDSLN